MDHLAEAIDHHQERPPSPTTTLRTCSQQKLKKTAARLSLELDPTPDILAEIGQRKGDRILVGFAAETQNLLEESRRKMLSKNCDMLVGNLVNQEGIGLRIRPERSRDHHPLRRHACMPGPADKSKSPNVFWTRSRCCGYRFAAWTEPPEALSCA